LTGSTTPIRPHNAGGEPSPWLPAIQASARSHTIRANEKSDASAVSREWPQQGADDIRRPIVAFNLDSASAVVGRDVKSPHREHWFHGDLVERMNVNTFLNRAGGVLPHEQAPSFLWIVENLSHGPSGQKRNLRSSPCARKTARRTPVRSLSHHLILVKNQKRLLENAALIPPLA
jgi:hypothetical protein